MPAAIKLRIYCTEAKQNTVVFLYSSLGPSYIYAHQKVFAFKVHYGALNAEH